MSQHYLRNSNIFYHLRIYVVKFFVCICFAVLFLQIVGVDGKLRIMQEGAVVKYANTKYITGVQVFTVRRRRNDPYLTNITATIHTPFGNNVTVKLSYLLPNGHAIDFSVRTCDAVQKPWMYEFAKMYSNLTVCPVMPGTYRYFNVEIPPKNFPYLYLLDSRKGIQGMSMSNYLEMETT